MDKVINLGIPHVGELIFESINTLTLIKFLLVSETWRILAENVLIKRIKKFKQRTFEALLWRACDTWRKDVVQLLIDNYPNLNARDDEGRTPFMIACNTGRKDVVQSIIDHSGQNIFAGFAKESLRLLGTLSLNVHVHASFNIHEKIFQVSWQNILYSWFSFAI